MASRILLVANGNPLSRDAVSVAAELRARVAGVVGVPVEVAVTEHAGHAREIAQRWSTANPEGLLVAVGGDGTLNEVANGVLSAAGAGREAAVSAYPAGNANDQFRSWGWRRRSFHRVVARGGTAPVDVLEVSWTSAATGERSSRVALSHVAVGLLAVAAGILNGRRHDLRTNVVILPVSLWRFRPVRVVLDGEEMTVDSLSWHVVPPMSKFLKVASNARRDDGLMEVLAVRHRRLLSRLRILWLAARALLGLGRQPQRRSTTMRWPDGGPLQLDGETVEVAPGSEVTVRCLPGALRMLSG